jgi:EpsD family peptidyl-prolyl cis-trans isomerase
MFEFAPAAANDAWRQAQLGRIPLLQASGLMDRRWRLAATVLALAGAIALAGCGKKQEGPAVVGQVIAHVGPDDVTQQELDNELRLDNVPTDKRTDEVIKAVLGRILERKYLDQQAIAAKLDREPTVHLDLLRSREQILAGAYVQRDLGAKVTAISKNEIDTYIQAHPEQFSKRQIYSIEQVSFPPTNNMDMISAETKDFKTIDQVEAKLDELGIKYSRGPGALDSATMPSQMLAALEARKPDDIFFIRSRTSASFFKVTSVESKPLTPDEAQQLGKRQLAAALAKKAAEDTSSAALASSKFEGDYARIMATATPAAAPPATPAAMAPTTPAVGGEAAPVEAPPAAKPGEEKQKDAPKN